MGKQVEGQEAPNLEGTVVGALEKLLSSGLLSDSVAPPASADVSEGAGGGRLRQVGWNLNFKRHNS